MPKRLGPDGGRYTRPRRGFGARSHYRDRLRKRGVSRASVRMETIDALRKRQRDIPGRQYGASGAGRIDSEVWPTDTDLQMPALLQMALDYLEELPGQRA